MVGKCIENGKKKRIFLARYYLREEEIGPSLRASRKKAERSRKVEHGREAFLESTRTGLSAVECFQPDRPRFRSGPVWRIMRIRSVFSVS